MEKEARLDEEERQQLVNRTVQESGKLRCMVKSETLISDSAIF